MKPDKLIKKWYAKIGSKGGRTTGPTKARGDSNYYRKLRKGKKNER